MMRIAKNRKMVSETARPDRSDENEFRNFRSTRRDKSVPTIPNTEMVVSATPSM